MVKSDLIIEHVDYDNNDDVYDDNEVYEDAETEKYQWG